MEITEQEWEKAHCTAAYRMAQYDKLPPAKRMFFQANMEFFHDSDVKQYDIKRLMGWRKSQISRLMLKLYGSDHPAVLDEHKREKEK